MPRMSREQRKRLELAVETCVSLDLTPSQITAYLKRFMPDLAFVDQRTIRRYKNKIRSQGYLNDWLRDMTKGDWLRLYKDRLDEILAELRKVKRMLLEEELLPANREALDEWKRQNPNKIPPRLQNRGYIIALEYVLATLNKRATQLQNTGPVAIKMRAILKAVSPDTPKAERERILKAILAEMEMSGE